MPQICLRIMYGSFLQLPETELPKEKMSNKHTEEELRACCTHEAITIPERLIEIERFFQLTRAIRAVDYVYRFIANLKQGVAGRKHSAGPLTSEDLQRAESLRILEEQWQSFPNEIVIETNNRLKPFVPSSTNKVFFE